MLIHVPELVAGGLCAFTNTRVSALEGSHSIIGIHIVVSIKYSIDQLLVIVLDLSALGVGLYRSCMAIDPAMQSTQKTKGLQMLKPRMLIGRALARFYAMQFCSSAALHNINQCKGISKPFGLEKSSTFAARGPELRAQSSCCTQSRGSTMPPLRGLARPSQSNHRRVGDHQGGFASC